MSEPLIVPTIEGNALPPGCRCDDCMWWKNCKDMIKDLTGEETACDWTPSRFVLHIELREAEP